MSIILALLASGVASTQHGLSSLDARTTAGPLAARITASTITPPAATDASSTSTTVAANAASSSAEAAASATSGGCVQGFYTDWGEVYPQNGTHRTSGAFISDANGVQRGNNLTLVGSDDGIGFWTLHGYIVDRQSGVLVVDFSPKGGPANLTGVCVDDGARIKWSGGNIWTRRSTAGSCFSGWPRRELAN